MSEPAPPSGAVAQGARAFPPVGDVVTGSQPSECASCGEQMPANECPKAQRPCGHHCNCSWVHDCCHWCGVEFGEDGAVHAVD